MNVNGHTLTIPYYSNHDLYEHNSQSRLAIISIHGDGRNGDEHYSVLNNIAEQELIVDTCIIITPLFLEQEQINTFQLDSTVLFFPSGTWNAGAQSRSTGQNPRPATISSFSVMDTIISVLKNKNPNLQKIIITGHSAGSQMVVRYAAGNRVLENISNTEGIEIHYIPINTPSFLYMDDARVVDEDATEFQFQPPADCYTHNYYKYGLDNLNEYMLETGVDQIREQYYSSRVIYLVGEFDYSGFVQNCNRMSQGSNIYKRTHIFYSYLNYFYDQNVYTTHTMAIVPGAGHNFEQMVQSECGKKSIFGSGDCDEIEADDPVLSITLKVCNPDTVDSVKVSSAVWNWQPELDMLATQTQSNDSLWKIIIDPAPLQTIRYLWVVNDREEDLILFNEANDQWEGNCAGYTDSSNYAYRVWSPDSSFFIHNTYETCYSCDNTLSIQQTLTYQNKNSDISIYPNPFNNESILKFKTGRQGLYSLSVYNLIGELAYHNSKDFPANKEVNFIIDFDNKNLPSGMYYYLLQSEDILNNGKFVFLK
tara:strand:- start:1718 stop:3325 length:1608 start_codon:yes stop_codon:yes gene_type:complete